MDATHTTLPSIPEDIREAIDAQRITLTPVERVNELLEDDALQHEAGYRGDGTGNWQVSMYCPMPGITPEMIEWWFWWHPQQDERYQMWFPGAHHSIRYDKKDADYFTAPVQPAFQDNIQYPRETIGGKTSTLEIDFVTPEEFGFSRPQMDVANIPLIVCGHVGLKGLMMHTEMAHIFRGTGDGLFMFSRFWMGNLLKSRLLKKIAMTDGLARGMAEHCCIEYRNLARILPELYKEQ